MGIEGMLTSCHTYSDALSHTLNLLATDLMHRSALLPATSLFLPSRVRTFLAYLKWRTYLITCDHRRVRSTAHAAFARVRSP